MGDNSVAFVKTIGALELLAAVGLILPGASDLGGHRSEFRGRCRTAQ
jgi:hypothetical protein